MPTIYDNIDKQLLNDGLREALAGARRADFCVGYFNLRGWGRIATAIDEMPGEGEDYPPCRLIVGMTDDPDDSVRRYYSEDLEKITQGDVNALRQRLLKNFVRQLASGYPSWGDENTLRKLAKHLRDRRLVVKFFRRYRLHAKLYLSHRADNVAALVGFVGSSNLTLAGLVRNGELNVDVLEQDAAQKLSGWFEDRWEDDWCLDISAELADIIENSWANGPVLPYHIYIKTAYHLSREAIEGAQQFRLPPEFADKMLDFQVQAVAIAAERLNRQQGVIIGDVVGLGKTRIASAVAKTFQDDHGDNVLVVCPARIIEMWEGYLDEFRISGKVMSLDKVDDLAKMRRYRLIIIDESHNFRNRNRKRYGYLRDYVSHNDARAILLTATPYNVAFADIANQLRLFLDPDEDLGIRPDRYINSLHGGLLRFRANHPTVLPTSLAAFEKSDCLDDWRELMRKFMVRRTRSHIKKNYAKHDKKKDRYYLTFPGGDSFYFPHREPRHISFALKEGDENDQYALLYSKYVVDTIGELNLPRYGLKEYLRDNAESAATKKEMEIIDNLTRAGPRLRGFLRAGLFKRLESCGPSFLLSVRRHILRNAVMLHAIETEGELLIGNIDESFSDDALEDDDLFGGGGGDTAGLTLDDFLAKAAYLYDWLRQNKLDKLSVLRAELFEDTLQQALIADSEELLEILKLVPEWDEASDRKLQALADLCLNKHGSEKIIIFTQFSDTAKYIVPALENAGVTKLELVHGGSDNITETVRRFSPGSNPGQQGILNELRVLVATDVLSEGQNLQDAHIIVNFDLPWAIIRLIQRAGRVDRIGQKAETIYCYSALPEENIELIINLRSRLRRRMRQNEELVGSDERFFEDDSAKTVRDLSKDQVNLEDSEDDETDLISRAYDIWNQAIKNDRELQKKIENMADVVYSAKQADDGKNADSVIAYIKDTRNRHILAQVNSRGEVMSQSQSYLLDVLACEPKTPVTAIADNHHKQVADLAVRMRDEAFHLSGQLGGAGSVQNRVYSKLKGILEEERGQLHKSFDTDTLKKAIDQIYNWPLKETARDRFRRQMQLQAKDEDLAKMAIRFFTDDELSQKPKEEDEEKTPESKIICSLGLTE